MQGSSFLRVDRRDPGRTISIIFSSSWKTRIGRSGRSSRSFSFRQNLTEGVTGPLRAAIDRIRKNFPRFLTMKTLMVGCAAGEGHLGACHPEDEDWVAEALHSCLKDFARRSRASLVVLKDFPAHYREALSNFSRNGYTRIASMPMTRLSLDYRRLRGIPGVVRQSDPQKFAAQISQDRAERADRVEVLTDVTPYDRRDLPALPPGA